MKELVKKIFSDESTRAEFVKDPASVISRFTLTEQEKKAVMNTHARLGLVTGNSAAFAAAIRPTIDWFAPTPVIE